MTSSPPTSMGLCDFSTSSLLKQISSVINIPTHIIVFPCQSLSMSSLRETNLFMDLLHAFVKIDIWISVSCHMDLSKLYCQIIT